MAHDFIKLQHKVTKQTAVEMFSCSPNGIIFKVTGIKLLIINHPDWMFFYHSMLYKLIAII